MKQSIVYEVTNENFDFAAVAASLRELSLLFPVMMTKTENPAGQYFVAMTQIRDQAMRALQAVDPRELVLLGFMTARVKCISQAIADMLSAKREARLADFMSGYFEGLERTLANAERFLPTNAVKLPTGTDSWLLRFKGRVPTQEDVSELYTLGRLGDRVYLLR